MQQRFRGGLVFNTHRLWYHSTLGLRVMKKKKRRSVWGVGYGGKTPPRGWRRQAPCSGTSRAPARIHRDWQQHTNVDRQLKMRGSLGPRLTRTCAYAHRLVFYCQTIWWPLRYTTLRIRAVKVRPRSETRAYAPPVRPSLRL